jgi:glycosyltransferase involved in cell wall biosynthesis
VACLSKGGDFADRLPNPGLVRVLNKPDGFSPRTVLRLRHLIRRLDPDLVHSHNLGALIYAACATWFGRTHPILHGEHGRPDEGPEAAKRDRQRMLFFKAARRVHTVSRSLLDHFLDAGFPESRMIALVNGVDTARFRPGDRRRARARLSLPAEAPVLAVVGRLIASKQHLLLFRSLEGLVDSFPEVILLVVGDGGTDQQAIREAARSSKVASHIRMEGFQPDPRPYYHAADLLVAPSRVEGLSNVVLEAMACGLPALLHDACGNRELIDDGLDGVVADLGTERKLAGAIKELLIDGGRLREYGRRAREKVLARFSLQGMAEAYEEIYRELASRRR